MNKLEMIRQIEDHVRKRKYYEGEAKYIQKKINKLREKCDHGIVVYHGSTVTTNVAECLFCGANHSCYNILNNAKNIIDMSKYVEGDPLLTYENNSERVKLAYMRAANEKSGITDEEAVKRINELLLGEN